NPNELNQDDARYGFRCCHLKNIWTAPLPPETELSRQMTTSTTSIDIMGLQAAYANLHTDQERDVSVSCAYTQGKREQFSGFNRTLDAINNVFRKFSAFHDETGRLNVDGMNIISNDGSNKLNRSRKARVSYKV